MALILTYDEVDNTTSTTYTVPSGSTFLLYAAKLTILNKGVESGYGRLTMRDDVAATVGHLFNIDVLPGQQASETLTFSPPLPIPSDYDFRVKSEYDGILVLAQLSGVEVV